MKKVLALVLVLAVMLPVMASADIATKLQGSTYTMEGHLEESVPLTATYDPVTGLEEKPQWVGNRYYNGDGSFATGWKRIGGYWYYFDPATGVKVTNKWIGSDKGGWYFLQNNGTMAVSTWVGDYYVGKDGCMYADMEAQIAGTWYYFNYEGRIAAKAATQAALWELTNYSHVYDQLLTRNGSEGTSLRHYNYNGTRSVGWYKTWDTGDWMYFNATGDALKDQWVGEYYIGSDYIMLKNQWVGAYYVGADGKRLRNTWMKLDGYWYFFKADGTLKKNAWEGDYYLGADGKMLTNQWVGNYYVGADGKWVK